MNKIQKLFLQFGSNREGAHPERKRKYEQQKINQNRYADKKKPKGMEKFTLKKTQYRVK